MPEIYFTVREGFFMNYKIIVDSCGELTYKMKESGIYETASLSMQVDGDTIVDDETFDQADFLRRVAASPECPKSSCPITARSLEENCGERNIRRERRRSMCLIPGLLPLERL